MKILLLFPPISVNKQSIKKCDLPLGLAYITAYLERNGHEVNVIDMSLEGYEREREYSGKITFGLDDKEIKGIIKNISPELIGISCPYSLQFHNVVHTSKLIKEVGDIPVVVGGVHPTFDAENILKTVRTIDSIVMGEGEATFLDLANGKALEDIDGLAYRKSGEVVVNSPRHLIPRISHIKLGT